MLQVVYLVSCPKPHTLPDQYVMYEPSECESQLQMHFTVDCLYIKLYSELELLSYLL